MDAPLKTWYCDVCGDKIEEAFQGYVIWQFTEHKNYGFKIIHQGKCDQKRHGGSRSLAAFLGPEGLSYCLTFLSLGPAIINNSNIAGHCQIQDFEEFADFVRRIQVPFYEEARRLYNDPDLLATLSDASEFDPYIPEIMQSLIQQYEADC